MILNFNNGYTYTLPIVHDGYYNSGLSNFPTWDDTYRQWYDEYSAPATFHLLDGFMAECATKSYFNRPRDLYSLCQDMQYPHEPEYYTEGGGRDNLDFLEQNAVWIYGSLEEGGLALVRVYSSAGYYSFITFSGIYASEEEGKIYYDIESPAYELPDGVGGVYTSNELTLGTICINTDQDSSEPPIWFCFQTEGNYMKYYIDYWQKVGGVDDRMEYGSIEAAMAVTKYTSYDFLGIYKCPVRAWINTMLGPEIELPNKGLEQLGGVYLRSGYSRTSGDLYGNAAVDEDSEPYAEGGGNTEDGGGGQFSGENDNGGWTDDDQFTIDALNSGFLTVYNPTKTQVKAFNDFLFTDIDDSIATKLKHLIVSPLDYVVYLAMVHFHPNLKENSQEIKFCGIGSGVTSKVVNKQMQRIECGTIFIDEIKQTGSFLSYAPYTKVRAYLPYIGSVELSADDIMGSYVTINYEIDLISGSCIAQIGCRRGSRREGDVAINNVVAEFTGNVFQDLPLSATDWRGLYQSVVAFSGGLVAAASGSAAGLGAMAASVMSQKESVARSGQLGSNYGYLGFQKPYILIERPIVEIANKQGCFQGWSTFISDKMKNFEGYTEIKEGSLNVKNIQGFTEEELMELEQLLTSGVYLNWDGGEF